MADDTSAVPAGSAGAGGISGSHPAAAVRHILVGPTTSSELNTVNTNLIPVACWRVEDIRFEFDSSFVLPAIATETGQLADLREKHKRQVGSAAIYPPLSIFGHADPVGNDDYNKTLSGRRAIAIYALLTRRPDLWQELYARALGNDDWIKKGNTWVEETIGLPAGAMNDPSSRQQHFRDYMDQLCLAKTKEGQVFPYQLAKEDFLAQGAHPGGKGDFQGCSEFNPTRLFSQSEQSAYKYATDKSERDAANAPNRRVVILLFGPGTVVDPSKWPCPAANAGKDGCINRFWSNGDQRRSTLLPEQRREFAETHDTFACRFYQRLTDNSPCESAKIGVATYRVTNEADGTPVKNTLFEITSPDGMVQQLRSDEAGMIRMSGMEGQEFTMIAMDDPKNPGTLKNKDS